MHKTETKTKRERGILVGCGPDVADEAAGLRSLDELEELARTAGVAAVDRVYQKRQSPDVTYFIGSGKVEEVAARVRDHEAQCVLFDNELTPRQVRNLEEKVGCKVLDRSEVILDIFASHAQTMEAKLQVELAQLRYTRPRLKRMWTHLSRITGQGGIGSRGPGEKQIETDRRLIDRRLHQLEMELEEIKTRKRRQVATRGEDLTVALVGYTNAGKSTLMNRLTDAGVYEADKLFATLDTKTSDFILPSGKRVLLSDTVGFVENLPHHLVASFHATLEEVRQAKLLVHLVDVSSPGVEQRIATVRHVIDDELGLRDHDELLVFNKIDAVEDGVELALLRNRFPASISVSARVGTGIDDLVAAVQDFDDRSRQVVVLDLDAGDGKTLAEVRRVGEILDADYQGSRVAVRVSMPASAVGYFRRFLSPEFRRAEPED